MQNVVESSLADKYLTFIIDNQDYGIEIKYITEIISIQPIIKVPDIPDYVKGIINLRGRVIPIIELRIRFKKESVEYSDKTGIVVIDIDDKLIGLIVDCVNDVVTIPNNDMAESSIINKDFKNGYINGFGKIEGNIILLLDCEKILTYEEIKNIDKIS
jgi:purine-binding chemotaxis protein CheW